jgi:hypothetical protein
VQLPVRIFGTDCQGRIFSENVTTIDVSLSGARLAGVRARIKVDEIVGLTCGRNKVHFRVKWIGQPGTPSEGQLGLQNLTPERPFWDLPMPHGAIDNFRIESTGDRRKSVRIKCDVPVELRPKGEPTMWGKATDLSAGGCFVEMPIPLQQDAKFEIALWLAGTKLRLQASVASRAPGFGIGVRFLNVSPADHEFLVRQLHLLALQTQAT